MNQIKANENFYRTLDYFLELKKMSRCGLSKKCGKDNTALNPSKMTKNRWIGVGFFLQICEALDIKPQDFFDKMLKEE